MAAAIRARKERRQNTKPSPVAPRRSSSNLLSSSSSNRDRFLGRVKKLPLKLFKKPTVEGIVIFHCNLWLGSICNA